MTFRQFLWLLALGLIALLAACAPASAVPGDGAARTLQTHLQALADKDEAAYSQALCPQWQMDALLEFDAYQGVKTTLDGLACRQSGTQGDQVLVTCQGKLAFSYANETRQVDLAQRVYHLSPLNGGWQVCGFDAAP